MKKVAFVSLLLILSFYIYSSEIINHDETKLFQLFNESNIVFMGDWNHQRIEPLKSFFDMVEKYITLYPDKKICLILEGKNVEKEEQFMFVRDYYSKQRIAKLKEKCTDLQILFPDLEKLDLSFSFYNQIHNNRQLQETKKKIIYRENHIYTRIDRWINENKGYKILGLYGSAHLGNKEWDIDQQISYQNYHNSDFKKLSMNREYYAHKMVKPFGMRLLNKYKKMNIVSLNYTNNYIDITMNNYPLIKNGELYKILDWKTSFLTVYDLVGYSRKIYENIVIDESELVTSFDKNINMIHFFLNRFKYKSDVLSYFDWYYENLIESIKKDEINEGVTISQTRSVVKQFIIPKLTIVTDQLESKIDNADIRKALEPAKHWMYVKYLVVSLGCCYDDEKVVIINELKKVTGKNFDEFTEWVDWFFLFDPDTIEG